MSVFNIYPDKINLYRWLLFQVVGDKEMAKQHYKNAEIDDLKMEEDSISTAVWKDGDGTLRQNGKELNHLHDCNDRLDVI